MSYKISDLLDTLLINCDLISSQSMLIYSLKLKLTLSRKQLIESQKCDIVDQKGHKSYINFAILTIMHDGVIFNKNNFGIIF